MVNVSYSNCEEFEDCVDEIIPGRKKKYGLTATKDGVGYKGDMLSPFTPISSSVTSGYRATLIAGGLHYIDLANLHEDSTYPYGHSVPMQGPFTRDHVGGYQYRHVIPLTPQYSGSAGARREGWRLSLDGTCQFSINSISSTLSTAPSASYGKYLRGLGSKSPVNIENIQTSLFRRRLGNFYKNYEVVQTSNRAATN